MTDEEVYSRCEVPVQRFFINKVHQDEDVEDLMHQVFLRFFEKRRNGFECEEPIPYLIGIAKNVYFEYLRTQNRSGLHEDLGEHSLIALGSGISTIMARAQNQQIVLAALRRIRIDYQMALELHYWEHMPYQEIAACLGVPSATIGTWLRRGREELRSIIEQGLAESGTPSEAAGRSRRRGPPKDDDLRMSNESPADSMDVWMEVAKEATSQRSEASNGEAAV